MGKWSLESTHSLLSALSARDALEAWERGIECLAAVGITPLKDPEIEAWLTVKHGEKRAAFRLEGQVQEGFKGFLTHVLTMALARVCEQASHAEALERSAMLSEASFEGLLMHDNGFVLDVNARLSALSGWDREELLGGQVISRAVAPEDQPEVIRRIKSGEDSTYLITAIRKDGSRFRAELQSKQGHLGERPVRVTALRDVTERERMLSLLKESERRISDLSNAVFDLTVLSRDGLIIAVDGPLLPAIGYTEPELIGRTIMEFIAPSERPVTRRQVTGGVAGRYETTLLDHSGGLIPVEVIAVNSTHEGLPTRVAGLRDLRPQRRQEVERYALQQRVERAHRLESLGVLSGGIAHDFNNLLVSVLGNAEILLEEIQNQDHRQMLESILIAAERGSELTSRLLSYAGRGDVAPTRLFSLSELVSGLLQLFPHRDAARMFDADIHEGCSLVGDRASLTQVLLNLLTNAIDASLSQSPQPAPPIRVLVRPVSEPDGRWEEALGATVAPGQWILIEIEDFGVGMDEATQARVFEPFFSTKPKGHGLGMAACLGIVEHHRGALHLTSKEGKGTCFSLLLPAAAETQRPTSAPPSGGTYRVLVVDDEEMVREQIRRSLSLLGHTVIEAGSAEACLEQLELSAPDVILLDIRMPGKSGIEVLREIRERGNQVPVVFVSGYYDEQQEDDLSRLSFQGFLKKPYPKAALIDAVEQALGVSVPSLRVPKT